MRQLVVSELILDVSSNRSLNPSERNDRWRV